MERQQNDLRESADDDEIKTAITVHGELKHKLEMRRLLDRRYAILVFEDLLESIAAKREMEHKWWNWVVRMEVNGGFKEDVAAAGLKVDFINRKTAVELIKSDDEARKKASAPPAYALVIPKKSAAVALRAARIAFAEGMLGQMDEQSVDALSVDEEESSSHTASSDPTTCRQ
ncbi:hypothetical protein AAVH_25938 [Aphelenchoides avenae]|nr:hypothetical protein AAVH_25938 [Aphelenchus avenae]